MENIVCISMKTRKSEKPAANPLVVLREEPLFNPDSSDAVGINPIGIAVW